MTDLRMVLLQQIDECLTTGQLTLGKYGKQLEQAFADYLGVKHAIAVNSGTSAIEIPLRALGVTSCSGGESLTTNPAAPAAIARAR